VVAAATVVSGVPPAAPKRANELTLARLRPGRDTLATAKALYGEKRRSVSADNGNVWTWQDECRKRSLRLEADEQGIIQVLTLAEEESQGDCRAHAGEPTGNPWRTGKGLVVGDVRAKVVDLYGPPNSISPSLSGSHELELLFYAFDWAGSDVPQVMEVTCDRASGRVVEITLSFPSL
jgi:hypothetical protein